MIKGRILEVPHQFSRKGFRTSDGQKLSMPFLCKDTNLYKPVLTEYVSI